MEKETMMILSAADPQLPIWFTAVLEKKHMTSLQLVLKEDQILFPTEINNLKAVYLEREGKKTGVVLLYTLLSDPFSVVDFLKVDGELLFKVPEVFSFLENPITGLDVCLSLIVPFQRPQPFAEQFVVHYQKDIELIPGFLVFSQAYLKILKQDVSMAVQLTGFFQIDEMEGGELYLSLDLGMDYIQGELGAATGKMPSFFQFSSWLLKKSGMTAGSFMDGVEEAEKIFQVTLSKAQLVIDIEDGRLEDYLAAFHITLWGLELEATVYGHAKLFRGSLCKDKPIRLSDLWQKISKGTVLPTELEAIELEDCGVEIDFIEKKYSFQCVTVQVCTIAGISLEQVKLVISTGEKTTIQVFGRLKLREAWNCTIGITYEDQQHYQVRGELCLPYFQTAFSYEMPKPEKNSLESRYTIEETKDGGYQTKKEAILPEQGVLREGDSTRWYALRKTYGVLRVERVGMVFENQTVWAALEAGMKIGPVDIGVLGLKVGFDLKKKDLCYQLNGFSISCRTSIFTLSGSLGRDLSLPESVKESFSGTLGVKMAKWELSAKGAYAVMKDETTSLFVFLNTRMLLSVMPALQITGIVGGMGLNRQLRLPTAEEVKSFPLLVSDKAEAQLISALNEWIVPAKGAYWVAAGIRFCACGLVEGNILLSFLFGKEIQAALLGSADLTLPKGSTRERAYAYLSFYLSALLRPEQGSFITDIVLGEDSFLLDHNCHVFGQAACGIWFGQHEKAGDFVLTVGGYHPSYVPPEHYPKVKSVGFSWQMSKELSAKGSAYLAVTPACVMAGGNLELLFVMGNLKAWFTAYVHLLLNWHPFFFDGQIGVEIGVSYRLNLLFCCKTIKASVGGSLHIWGLRWVEDCRYIWLLSALVSLLESHSLP